jgi:hypothetical protein
MKVLNTHAIYPRRKDEKNDNREHISAEAVLVSGVGL